MKLKSLALAVVFLAFFSSPASAKIIHVPADSSTIQGGIHGAVNGDTVLVERGHYYERINFNGKAILVAGNFIFDNDTNTIDSTIIDADTSVLGVSDTGSVVCFTTVEGSSSIIQGFTIRNGIGTQFAVGGRKGGGIFCNNSSPTIKNNVILNNRANHGGGIYCSRSSPTITANTISYNCAESGGGGIYCYDSSLAEISYNVISHDTSHMNGAGIGCSNYSSATISNNIISYNVHYNDGGGINLELHSAATIVNNTIDRNGSGGTCGGEGSGIAMQNSDCVIKNNIVSNSRSGTGIDDRQDQGQESSPTIMYNNAWNNLCGNYVDLPSKVGEFTTTNFNGDPSDRFYNISLDPMFADTASYALLCRSACIDAGHPGSEVPVGGGRRIDIGVYEYAYIVGDANQDGEIGLSDIVYLINCLFKFGPCPCPLRRADVNCDGSSEVSDIVYLINHVFKGGPPPCE